MQHNYSIPRDFFYLEGTYKKYKKLALIPAFGRFLPLIKMTLQRKYFCIHHSVFFILPTKADVFSMCDTIVLVVERNYIFKSFDSRHTLQMTWYPDEKWYVSENWRELYTVCSSRSSEMNFFFFVLTGFIYFDLVNWCVWNKRKTNQL